MSAAYRGSMRKGYLHKLETLMSLSVYRIFVWLKEVTSNFQRNSKGQEAAGVDRSGPGWQILGMIEEEVMTQLKEFCSGRIPFFLPTTLSGFKVKVSRCQ